MSKWANYGISKKQMDSENKHIEKVLVHWIQGNNEVEPAISPVSRQFVVDQLDKGRTFVTILKNEHGEWEKGEEVGRVPIGGTVYIRTDGNKTEKDNLGNLPDF